MLPQILPMLAVAAEPFDSPDGNLAANRLASLPGSGTSLPADGPGRCTGRRGRPANIDDEIVTQSRDSRWEGSPQPLLRLLLLLNLLPSFRALLSRRLLDARRHGPNMPRRIH